MPTPAQFAQTFTPVVGDRDDNDLRQNASAAFPPEFYVGFLGRADVKAKIGATSTYGECPDAPFELFVKTGDVSVAAGGGGQMLNMLHRMRGRCCPSWRRWSTRNSRSSSGYAGKRPASTRANPVCPSSCAGWRRGHQVRPRDSRCCTRRSQYTCSCNWVGGHAAMLAMEWYGRERLKKTPFTNMTIDGRPVAAVQNVDNFSFA